MRTGLRLAALAVAFVALVAWLFGGAHRGFTKTQVLVTEKDPVTEQEINRWQDQLVLGVDFLAAAGTAALLLAGASWFFGRKINRNSVTQT